MSEAEILAAFEVRCAALGVAAREHGLTLSKSHNAHELIVSSTSGQVVFPIVTDPADWKIMTPEAAFYGAMVDAKSWKGVHLDDATTASLSDGAERDELPLISREAGIESTRMSTLATLVGGEVNLEALLAKVE